MKKSVHDFSVTNNLPHIEKEYAGDIDIKELGFDSTIKVKWVCEKGHEVIESPHTRLRRKNAFCPICGKNRLGSLSDVDKEMAKLYSSKNSVPENEICCESTKVVEWECEKGHTWKRSVANQRRIRTCPVCSKKVASEEYSIFKQKPELEKEWDKEKNADIDASAIMPSTNKKVWWICEKGHSYTCSVADKNRGKGCPICAGKKVLEEDSIFATDRVLVDKYWDYEKNSYSPKELPNTSKRKVWVIVNGESKTIPVCEILKLK